VSLWLEHADFRSIELTVLHHNQAAAGLVPEHLAPVGARVEARPESMHYGFGRRRGTVQHVETMNNTPGKPWWLYNVAWDDKPGQIDRDVTVGSVRVLDVVERLAELDA